MRLVFLWKIVSVFVTILILSAIDSGAIAITRLINGMPTVMDSENNGGVYTCRVDEEPVVRTTLGYVKGNILTSRNNGSFYAFRGIRYAKAPIGNLRFQKPVVADPYTDTYDATKDATSCPQYFQSNTSEDCLVVNVYSKKLPTLCTNIASLLPVLVFIPGGGFFYGSGVSYIYYPEAFLNRDVVLVTVDYRLGSLGFLSTGDSAAYGNAGLLDQVMALKWVQDNVAAFGGDPQKVVLFGQSAGAASVIFHLLSPLSTGLFQAAIAESGSALCSWAVQNDPLEYAIQLGRSFNCSEDNTTSLVECLQQQSSTDIVNSSNDLYNQYGLSNLIFTPVVEAPNEEAFLQEDPLQIILEGRFHKVPVISGVVKNEGYIINNHSTNKNMVLFRDHLPEVISIALQNDDFGQVVTNAVRQEYFGDINLNNESEWAFAGLDLLSDGCYKDGNDLTVRLLAAGGSTVYMYVFDYAGSGSPIKLFGKILINHEAELYYLFNANQTMTESDMRISDALIDMWINFAEYHNPTPDGSEVMWMPTPIGTTHHLRIADNLTMENKNYRAEKMHFWTVEVPKLRILAQYL